MSAQNASHLNNNTSDQCSDNSDGRSNAIGSGSLGVPRGTIRVFQPFCPQICFDVMAKAYRNGEVSRRRGEMAGVILTVDACWGSDVRWIQRRSDRTCRRRVQSLLWGSANDRLYVPLAISIETSLCCDAQTFYPLSSCLSFYPILTIHPTCLLQAGLYYTMHVRMRSFYLKHHGARGSGPGLYLNASESVPTSAPATALDAGRPLSGSSKSLIGLCGFVGTMLMGSCAAASQFRILDPRNSAEI